MERFIFRGGIHQSLSLQGSVLSFPVVDLLQPGESFQPDHQRAGLALCPGKSHLAPVSFLSLFGPGSLFPSVWRIADNRDRPASPAKILVSAPLHSLPVLVRQDDPQSSTPGGGLFAGHDPGASLKPLPPPGRFE